MGGWVGGWLGGWLEFSYDSAGVLRLCASSSMFVCASVWSCAHRVSRARGVSVARRFCGLA